MTDYKPLLSLFGPTKATPQLVANRLARCALMLSQYDYTVDYRKTSDHGNADALSRLPAAHDSCFDREESKEDTDCIFPSRLLVCSLIQETQRCFRRK